MLSTKYISKFLETRIREGQKIALGTSDTSAKVLKELALKNILFDLNLQLIPTDTKIATLAQEYDIKTTNIDSGVDLVIEFADRVDRLYNYTKKDSDSLIRDKLIAYHAKEVIVFTKLQSISNTLVEFPIEVSKFGIKKTISVLDSFGDAKLRVRGDNTPKKTINQNFLVDLKVQGAYNYEDLNFKLKETPGIIETGLFINLADRIFTVDKKRIDKMIDSINRSE